MLSKSAMARQLRQMLAGSAETKGALRKSRRPAAQGSTSMNFGRISRRHLLQGSAALALGSTIGARGAQAADNHDRLHLCRFARRLRLQPGPMPQGAAALKKMPGLKVIEEEKVPENRRGREDHRVHDQSRWRHALVPEPRSAISIRTWSRWPPNTRSSASSIAGACGPTRTRRTPAAISAISTRRNISPASSAGYTSQDRPSSASSRPSRSPQVLRNINAFTLGAKLANPKATTQVIFTGDWSMPVKEAEATNSLIDQGVDVLTCHVDGPKTMVENAARRGGHGLRLSRQPVAAGAEGLSHRRGVELGSAVSEIRQDDRGRAKPSRTSIAAG